MESKRLQFIRKQAIDTLELTKGFSPEQRERFSNELKTAEELAGYVLEVTNIEAQPGAVWVKAEKVRDSIGIPYHAKDEESKGAGTFDVNGHFTWGDGSITFRHCQDDLLILDESAAGMEENKAHFDNWHRWLSDNGYTYDGEYYYDEDNNYFTPDQLWVKFK